jgi:nitronate monooxygenase
VSDVFKQTYLDCREEDICIIDSPVGLPGRAIMNDFIEHFSNNKERIRCPYSCITSCKREQASYCIAEALLQAKVGNMKEGFAFAGANAYRVKEILSVHDLISKINEEYSEAVSATVN